MPTRFQTDLIAVTLPEGWTDNSAEEETCFVSRSTQEELTIGVWTIDSKPDAAALADIVPRLLEARAKALVDISRSAVEILDAAESKPTIPSVARFTAFVKQDKVFCHTVAVGYPTHAVAITYCKYACPAAAPAVAERSMDIMRRVAIKAG